MNRTVGAGGPGGPPHNHQTANNPATAVTALPSSMFAPPTQTNKVKVTLVARVNLSVQIKKENLEVAYKNLMCAFLKSISIMADGIKKKSDIQILQHAYNTQNGILKAVLYVPKTVEKVIKESIDGANLLNLSGFGNVAVGLGDKEYTFTVTIAKVPYWWTENELKVALKAKNLELLSAKRATEEASGLMRCTEWLGQVASNTELPDSGDLHFKPDNVIGSTEEVGPQEAGEILKLRVFRSSSIPAYLLEENPETEQGFTFSPYHRIAIQSSWKQGPSDKVLQAPSLVPLKIIGGSCKEPVEETGGKSKNSPQMNKNNFPVTVGVKSKNRNKKKGSTVKARAEANATAEAKMQAGAVETANCTNAGQAGADAGEQQNGGDGRDSGSDADKNDPSGNENTANGKDQPGGTKPRTRSQTQQGDINGGIAGGGEEGAGNSGACGGDGAGTRAAGGGEGVEEGGGTDMNNGQGQ